MAADVFSDASLFSEFEQERSDQKFISLSDSEEKEVDPNSTDIHSIKKKHALDQHSCPVLEVVINDDDFSRKYRHKIESFLDELIVWERAEAQRTRAESLRAKNWNANKVANPITLQYFHDFKVDRRGCRLQSHVAEPKCSCLDIIYEQLFKAPLPVEEEDLLLIKREQKKKLSCFNCDGDHNMSECPLPKDQYKIRENRRKHQDNSSLPKLSLSKNYSDFEENPRFKKFRPGRISKELSAAMGIDQYRLPPYIYRMRMSGYPPGWMQCAKKGYSSGIKIFDKEGKETNLKGETLEEGEINADGAADDPQLEPEKIIEYPGFTIPTPEGVMDESERFNMPALQIHQLKDTLMQQVSLQETARKRQAEEEEAMERKRLRVINKEADMEMSDEETEADTSVIIISDETSGNDSDFPPPLPVETPPKRPPLPIGTPPVTPHPPPLPNNNQPPLPDGTPPPTPPVLGPVLNRETSGSQSPSFENLEAQHQLILQQLVEEESSQSEVEIVELDESTNEDSDSAQKSMDIDQTTRSTSGTSSTSNEESSDSASNSTNTGQTPDQLTRTMSRVSSTVSVQSQEEQQGLSRGTSLGLVYGTPIIATSSSDARLPDRDKFKQGAEEHLFFENLPGATGTFSKMRELLGKIKSKIGKKK